MPVRWPVVANSAGSLCLSLAHLIRLAVLSAVLAGSMMLADGLLLPGRAALAEGRTRIQVIGSSTVFPFAATVAERFGRRTGKAPIVEATGTGGGIRLFCAGTGNRTPDIVTASRRMTAAEAARCRANGVTPVEVPVGFDGIVLARARSAPAVDLTREQLYLALAAEIPDAEGRPMANPLQSWSEITGDLPPTPILVLGPPPTSGTRDALNGEALAAGCATAWRRVGAVPDAGLCQRLRSDGAYVDAGENDNIIVQRLVADPAASGIFGLSFFVANQDLLQAARIDAVAPTVAAIADGRYPLVRPLFLYVKREHVGVVPGLLAFVDEYLSEAAMGEAGYLARKGLVPLPSAGRAAAVRRAAGL